MFTFPDGFFWGAATASYQIEGAFDEGGRGLSIWDQFAHTPGKVLNGDTGDQACDHYHLWSEDVNLMKQLGLNAYRFSVAWPRILPEGRGKVNQSGLDFYDRLVDALLAANITPFLTLYHWDLPLALHEQGGWNNRQIVEDFALYTRVLAEHLGDRVKHWMTLNEPAIFTWLGYLWGIHAPGFHEPHLALQAAHHVLLAHGASVRELRKAVPQAQIGLALSVTSVEPHTNSEEDRASAIRSDAQFNRWFIEPIIHGHYPQEVWSTLGDYAPQVQDQDLAQIKTEIDFIGLNYYTRTLSQPDPDAAPFYAGMAPWPAESEYTDLPWEVYPEGLYNVLTRFQRDFPVSAYYITESGAAYNDSVSPDGQVHDPKRKSYLERHFAAAARAISEGVPLKGYFPWSLMDNFEWAVGYSKRFGLVYVDYKTQKRIPKDSALWYRDFIQQQKQQ
jgi:beta-glucosidase